MEYGNYCKHGVYVGTPGGPDYMCGYCESGLDVWHDDPGYIFALTFGGTAEVLAEVQSARFKVHYRQSDLDQPGRRAEVLTEILARTAELANVWGDIDSAPWHLVHAAAYRVDSGYWDEV